MPYDAVVCPYCNEPMMMENFGDHAYMAHGANLTLPTTKEVINNRFMHLGGVIYGEFDDLGKFRPFLT